MKGGDIMKNHIIDRLEKIEHNLIMKEEVYVIGWEDCNPSPITPEEVREAKSRGVNVVWRE
jgi:hypothetical protein